MKKIIVLCALLVFTCKNENTAQSAQPDLYDYDVEAYGEDEPAYSLTENPAGMTINPTSGLIEWTPSLSQRGSHTVTVQATNSAGSDLANTAALRDNRSIVGTGTSRIGALSTVPCVPGELCPITA